MRLLLRQGLRHHLRHPLQTLLTLLGIAAGTALLVAMQLAQGTAEASFDAGLRAIAGDATHVVTAGPEGLPVATYARVRAALHGRGVAPSISAIVRAKDRADRAVLRVLGVDPLADFDLRPWSGRAPAGERSPLGPLLTVPGAFVATAALQQRLGLHPGASLRLQLGGRTLNATCVGTIDPPPPVAAGLADVLVVDLATAQEWTGRRDRVDRLELRLADDQLAAAQQAVGADATLASGGAHRQTLANLARGFRTNLRALSLLSLLVGAFLVHETMRLSVAARRRSFGVLRALGAPARALGLVVAGEATALGIVGSALGVVLGTGAARLLLDPLVQALNDHYATFELHHVDVDPAVLGLGLLLGSAVALLAGLAPAIAASRVPPREVLVAGRRDDRRRTRHLLHLAAPAAVAAALLLSTVGDRLVQAYCGLLALVVALVAVVPPAMTALLRVAAAAVAPLGPFARYVVRSTAAARDHLALPVAAMVLALATTIGLGTMVASFRSSVDEWLVQVLPADVYVSVPAGQDEKFRATLRPEVIDALRTDPRTVAFSTYHRTKLPVRAGRGAAEVEVCGMAPTPEVLRGFGFVSGDDVAGREALLRGEGAWVSEPLSFRLGIAVGDELEIDTGRGPAHIRVSGIHREYSNERGEVIVGADWLERHVHVDTTAMAVQCARGTDVEAWVQDLRARAAAASDQEVLIRSNDELRRSSMAIFDRTFAITSVMRLLCLLVAFFGIYAAFATLQYERAAEIGLLRCLGARPARIGLVVLGQTALLGLVAGLLSLPAGALFGHVLADIVNRVSFGWSLPAVAVPGRAVVEVLLLAVGASLLAGVQPAVRFARMRPADALREG